MKKALVLGATGGMGFSLVNELINNQIEVVAFGRNEEKLNRLYTSNQHLTLFKGDGFKQEDLLQVARGVDVIFHSISVPYERWTNEHPRLMMNVLEVAEEIQAKVVIVDNIYAYGKGSTLIKETSPKNPHTKKGNIRLQLEEVAATYQANGLPVLFAHFPDFYGPNAESTYLHTTFDSIIKNKKPVFVGDLNVEREYIFTPDGARALVQLAQKNDAYNEHWNIPGHSIMSGKEIIQIAAKITNNHKKPMSIKKWMIAMFGIFNPFMKEVVEMFYLTEQTFKLSGEKYEREIGPLQSTSYEKGIEETLQWYMKK